MWLAYSTMAMITHAKSAYSFFTPYVTGGVKAIPESIRVLLRAFLHHQIIMVG
jgi:hypothetical protein